jgi:hypothetical protein
MAILLLVHTIQPVYDKNKADKTNLWQGDFYTAWSFYFVLFYYVYTQKSVFT